MPMIPVVYNNYRVLYAAAAGGGLIMTWVDLIWKYSAQITYCDVIVSLIMV